MDRHGAVQNQYARVPPDTQGNVKENKSFDLCHGCVKQVGYSVYISLIMLFCQVDLIRSKLRDVAPHTSSC